MTRTLVHFSDSREFGGTEQSLLHLLARLDQRRWRLVLYHQVADGITPLLTGARKLGVELRPVPPMLGRQGLAHVPGLARALRAERPMILHAHLTYPLSCKFGLVAAALARVPAVVATAQLYLELPRTRSIAAQHWIVDAAVDRYIAVSHEVAERLRQRFGVPPGKIRVVQNGIALAPFGTDAGAPVGPARVPGARRPVVLTAARLDTQKGHNYLLAAAALVPEAEFVLAGDGQERSALEAQARRLGIGERVHFLGYRSDIPALLAEADLFVLPSLYEGLPLSVLEAMAAGLPVIATAIGGTEEAIVHGETGLLVPPGDPAALARAIRLALSDADLARRIAAAGKERAHREFSADLMAERVTRVYDDLLSPTEARRAART